MLSSLFSRAWWSIAGQRALRTMLVAIVPFVPALIGAPDGQTYIAAGSTVALAAVLSLFTSAASLPEANGLPRAWWVAALDRFVRTFAQVAIASIPAVTVIQDVPWTVVLTNAAASAVGSLLLALIAALPETQPITVPVKSVVQVQTSDGRTVTGPASPLGAGVEVHKTGLENETQGGYPYDPI